jgi:hypothetical protein
MGARQSTQRQGTVLLVDVAASTGSPDFRAVRDRNLKALSKLHLDKRWTGRPYTVTAWDEFQTVSWQWPYLPQILFDVRRIFAPWELYVGVGFGAISGWRSKRPINEALSGEGFERARSAMDSLKNGKGDKFNRLTRFHTGDVDRDALLDLIYGLHDTLIQQVSARQWEMIAAAHGARKQEDVADAFGLDPSTVTRSLKRGHYWQMLTTMTVLTEQLAQGGWIMRPALSQ